MTQAVEQVCNKDLHHTRITHSHTAFLLTGRMSVINLTHVTLVTNCRRIDF